MYVKHHDHVFYQYIQVNLIFNVFSEVLHMNFKNDFVWFGDWIHFTRYVLWLLFLQDMVHDNRPCQFILPFFCLSVFLSWISWRSYFFKFLNLQQSSLALLRWSVVRLFTFKYLISFFNFVSLVKASYENDNDTAEFWKSLFPKKKWKSSNLVGGEVFEFFLCTTPANISIFGI